MRSPKEYITTLLFDWDGTLFDSAEAGFAAFEKTFAGMGVAFTREFYESHYSPNWYTIYEQLNIPREQWQRADEVWLEQYGKQPPRLVEQARETIRELQGRGYQLGIVSSGSRSRIFRELDTLALRSTFAVVICNEDTINKKPHPEGLEKALNRLQAERATCAYIGDAPEDIEMGKKADLLTIGVPSAYPTKTRLLNAQPDIFLSSICEILLHF